jgi:hypothetical protein
MEHAFEGVLNVHMEALTGLSGAFHTHGSLPSRLFDIVLLWQPGELLRQRATFPSWSWVVL